MGYTHHWEVKYGTDPKKLAAAQHEMHEIIVATKVPLGDGHGTPGSKPIEEEGLLLFNGVGDDGLETFGWPPDFALTKEVYEGIPEFEGASYNFCKTARLPYDQTVVACLLVAQDVLGDDIRVFSDGEPNEFLDGEEVDSPESARSLYERVTGRTAELPPRFEE